MSAGMDRTHLDWPFFDAAHRALAADADRWAIGALQRLKTEAEIRGSNGPAPQNDYVEANVDAICRRHVASLGAAGLLRHCVPARFGGASAHVESRSVCVLREALAWHDGLADFAFAMQGLGAGPIALAVESKEHPAAHWLSDVAHGTAIAAFALSEPDAGSDVAAITSRAVRDGDEFVIDGCKTWISNGGIADFYCVFLRTSDEPASRGISAFVVPADSPGLSVAQRIDVIAPHPLARLEFDGCRVPATALLGNPGDGFKLAMRTLDIFRASVGAAAVGFARRALDESIGHARTRKMLGGMLAERDVARSMLGQMAADIDAAALLVYRAAWTRDVKHRRTTKEAAMAKLVATELAQRVIDNAVQLHGARGVARGECVERLYREIRSLRIYEGATEVQRLVIGRELLRPQPTPAAT
ncbi:MAG TPA: acyl-CoA dehydrogenase family protein [Casimicrobiaceae bacterium]|nr:acyl-CoA dehydrogenase family protein [Casimicrobiaceae bacterium]